jgi:hypothetical protein
MCPQFQPFDPTHSSEQSVTRCASDSRRPIWLSAAEAGAFFNFKPRTILLWARQGRIKAYALTGTQRRVWRFLQTDLEAMLTRARPVVSSAQPSVLAHERSRL